MICDCIFLSGPTALSSSCTSSSSTPPPPPPPAAAITQATTQPLTYSRLALPSSAFPRGSSSPSPAPAVGGQKGAPSRGREGQSCGHRLQTYIRRRRIDVSSSFERWNETAAAGGDVGSRIHHDHASSTSAAAAEEDVEVISLLASIRHSRCFRLGPALLFLRCFFFLSPSPFPCVSPGSR